MKILEANNITKYFPGVKALSNVDFDINRGEIHCIIGENGAGKSTLIKCLTGVYHPEEGRILIDEKDTKKNPELFNKVAYVPQELDLFNDLTVAENLFLPFDKTGIKGFINPRQLEKKALPLLKKFKINVQPDMLIRDIPVSAQQLVQIVRATVHQNYEVLMLDEPTTSLTTEDTATLFEAIRDIKAAGKAVIFISHKLEEILALGDVVTVFRNGQKVVFANVKDIDIPWIIRKMTGHALNHEKTFFSGKVSEKVLLEVENLTGDKFYDISFRLHEGEILGFAGLVGAGRSEIMQAIFGYTPVYSGKVLVHGQKWKLGDTSYSVHNGLVYLPEERKKQGIFPILSVKENISMPLLDKLKAVFTISKKKEDALANEVISSYSIKTPDNEKQIKYLSGGNQQKVIIGRAMSCSPKILIFDEPTKGIDVGTKAEIYSLMQKLAEENGIGIILISSELEEIRKCANRIITFYEGKKYGEFTSDDSKEAILSAMIGVQQ